MALHTYTLFQEKVPPRTIGITFAFYCGNSHPVITIDGIPSYFLYIQKQNVCKSPTLPFRQAAINLPIQASADY